MPLVEQATDKELEALIDRAIADKIPEDELDILVDEYKKSKEPGTFTKFMRGADQRIGETIMAIPRGLADAAVTAYEQPGEFVRTMPEAVASLPGMVWQGVKDTVSDAMSGDPAKMGSAATDVASVMIPSSKAMAPVTRSAAAATGRGMRTGIGATAMKTAGSQGGLWSFMNSMREQIADVLDPPRLVRKTDPVYGAQTTMVGGTPSAAVEPTAASQGRYIRPTEEARGPSAASQPMAPLREMVEEAEPAPIPLATPRPARFIPSTPPARVGYNVHGRGPGPRTGGGGGPVGGGPSVAEATAAAGGDIDTLFKTLSNKPVLTPAEQTQLAQLREVLRQRASNRGMGYAAR